MCLVVFDSAVVFALLLSLASCQRADLEEFTNNSPHFSANGTRLGSPQAITSDGDSFLLYALFAAGLAVCFVVVFMYCCLVKNQDAPASATNAQPSVSRSVFDNTLTVLLPNQHVASENDVVIADSAHEYRVPQSLFAQAVESENCYESTFSGTDNHPIDLVTSLKNYPSDIHLMDDLDKKDCVFVSFVTHM